MLRAFNMAKRVKGTAKQYVGRFPASRGPCRRPNTMVTAADLLNGSLEAMPVKRGLLAVVLQIRYDALVLQSAPLVRGSIRLTSAGTIR